LKLIKKTLPDNFNLFFFGDTHWGSILSTLKGWNKLVGMMHSKYEGCSNNYGAHGGDMIEAITVDDYRFDIEELKKKQKDGETPVVPLEQADYAAKKLEPIKDKLLYILMGNHERKLTNIGNLTRSVANQLGVDYGTYTAKITIQDTSGNLMFKIYDTHGTRSINSTADDPIRKEANEKLILKRHLKHKAGDCAVMIKHHVHKLIVCKPKSTLYLTDDTKKIKQKYTTYGQTEEYIHPDARWYGCAGAFLRLYGDGISGYAEIAEYDPVELGFLILIVRRKRIVELRPIYLNL